MGKNNKSKYFYDDIHFDSKEEIDFYIFLKNAKKLHIFIKDFEYQPPSFELIPKAEYECTKELKSKSKVVHKTMYRAHKYTADFRVEVDDLFIEKYGDLIPIYGNHVFYVDVKGTYNRFGGDRIFPIHQKLLYFMYGFHVLKINPEQFFQLINLVPEEVAFMKKRKNPTLKQKFKNINILEKTNLNELRGFNQYSKHSLATSSTNKFSYQYSSDSSTRALPSIELAR